MHVNNRLPHTCDSIWHVAPFLLPCHFIHMHSLGLLNPALAPKWEMENDEPKDPALEHT